MTYERIIPTYGRLVPTIGKLFPVNELSSGNPWRGKLYLVAIYNRALSLTEARRNWLAGQ